MNDICFLTIHQNAGVFNDDHINFRYDSDESLKVFRRHNDDYDAIRKTFSALNYSEEEVDRVIYRLRLRLNRTRHIFFNIYKENKEKYMDDATHNLYVVEQYLYISAQDIEMENYDSANFFINLALSINNQALFAYANKGAIALRAGKKYQALEIFNRALKLDPLQPQLLANKMELIATIPETTLSEFTSTVYAVLYVHPLQPTALSYAIQLAVHSKNLENAVSYLKVYFTYYYLEKNFIPLMHSVISMLAHQQAKETMIEMLNMQGESLAARVLHDYSKARIELFGELD